MKQVWIGIVAGMMVLCGLQAQEGGNNLRRWEQGKLTWNDFSKTADGRESTGVSCLVTYGADHRRIHDTTVYYLLLQTFADRDSSRISTAQMNEGELRLQQLIFDLAELQSRKMQQEVNRLRKQSEVDCCLREGMRQLGETAEQLKTASRQGADKAVLSQWEEKVRQQLASMPDSLETVPSFTPALFGFGAGVGIGSHLYTGKLQEYFQPKADVTLNLDFAIGRAELMLHAGLGGTSVKADSLPIPGERWSSDDHLEYCQLSAALGFKALDRGKWQVIPFAGYGSTEISTIAGQNDKVKHQEKTGGWLGGLCLDCRLRTSLNIAPNYLPTKECHSIALRAKAYVAQADFNDHLQGMTINFSLSINVFDQFVKLEQIK